MPNTGKIVLQMNSNRKVLFVADSCNYYENYTWRSYKTIGLYGIWKIEDSKVWYQHENDSDKLFVQWYCDFPVTQKAYLKYLMGLITNE